MVTASPEYVAGFKEAIRLAMEECHKYIDRRRASSAATDDINVHFSNRERIQAAVACCHWIELIQAPEVPA